MTTSILTDDVQEAFEEMKTTLRNRGYSESIVDITEAGVSKGILRSMLRSMSQQDQKFYLDLIRTMYKS